MKNQNNFDAEFTEKYKIYGEMLYKIAFLYTKNNADTEDVLQDVFMKYFSLKKDFSTKEEEKAWFIRITQNKSIDYIRKNRNFNKFKDYKTVFQNENSDADIKEDILNKIFLLENKYKTVVILFYYYGYSLEEIAKTLKISTSAAKKRLQRAREKLKIELEDYKI